MPAVLDIILPVFLLIAAGWVLARFGLLSREGEGGLSNVTFYLLVPALLFRSMLRVDVRHLDEGVIGAYFLATFVLFVATWIMAGGLGRRPAGSAVTALGASFSNTVALGLPLASLAFGDTGVALLTMIIAIHSTVLLSLGAVLVDIGLRRERAVASAAAGLSGPARASTGAAMRFLELARLLGASLWSTLKHPVIPPLLAGLACGYAGVRLPGVLDRSLALLAQGAGPCMLILLGASLGHLGFSGHARRALPTAAVKLAVHPALAWAAGRYLLDLPPTALAIVTLTAALPSGANVYLIAKRYEIAVGEAAATIVVATGLSALTLSFVLDWLR